MKLELSSIKRVLPVKRKCRTLVLAVLAVVGVVGVSMVCRPLPKGVDFTGEWRVLPEVRFWRDITFTDASGVRGHDQQIMDTMFDLIANAETLLVLDQFLFNDFAGKEDSILRPLSHELTDAIVVRRKDNPDLAVWFITDPLNTLYGGVGSSQQKLLRESGVELVETRLTALRDSNPLYSAWWRVFLRHWPLRWGPQLPNPVGPGRVPLRSYLDLLNFKANHRKTVVADRDGELWGMISSANPHDASSAHHNVAVTFRGNAAYDLLETERAAAAFSGMSIPVHSGVSSSESVGGGDGMRGRILTERAVERAALDLLDHADAGDQVMLAMFYLSSRPIVRALRQAQSRGVEVRVLLDPNKDAFGREKNGVPNRPVGARLQRAGVAVRWALTHGEQFHTKMLVRFGQDGEATAIIGSSNYTRRNLKNYNLETCMEIRGPASDAFFQDVKTYLQQIWANEGGRIVSGDYEAYADARAWHHILYVVQEVTGLSTF